MGRLQCACPFPDPPINCLDKGQSELHEAMADPPPSGTTLLKHSLPIDKQYEARQTNNNKHVTLKPISHGWLHLVRQHTYREAPLVTVLLDLCDLRRYPVALTFQLPTWK